MQDKNISLPNLMIAYSDDGDAISFIYVKMKSDISFRLSFIQVYEILIPFRGSLSYVILFSRLSKFVIRNYPRT